MNKKTSKKLDNYKPLKGLDTFFKNDNNTSKDAEPSTEQKIVKTTLYLPETLWLGLKQKALTERKSFKDITIEAVNQYLLA